MPILQASIDGNVPAKEKQAVALSSLIAAALLTTMKLLVGFLTGSLGILSEGAHSGLDFVSAAVTYFSVRLADKPADSSHPFGHGKIEHLSALIETGLLLVTCAWIILEAARRLFFRQVHVEPSVWAFGALFISVTVDSFRSRALFRVARKYNSQALEADALHFSTDVYSTSVVILGLILVSIAEKKQFRWLEKADPLAALAVAGIVILISVRLGKKTVDALVDAAPEGTSVRIAEAVSSVPGVLGCSRIRARQSGHQMFVDLGLTLESDIPFEHAQAVADSVRSKVGELFPAADVLVYAAPREPASHDLIAKIRSIAHRQNYQIHNLTAYQVGGRVNVSLDLELDPTLTLEGAHDQATKLENEIQNELPEVGEVNVHVEPLLKRVETANEATAVQPTMEQRLATLARETPELLDVHSVEAHQTGEEVLVSLHCTLEPDLPLARVHVVTEDLEFKFRKAFPNISRVNIHAEPKTRA